MRGGTALSSSLLALTVAAFGLLYPGASHGQPATPPASVAQQERTVAFDIPPQDLDTALTRLADQGGVRLLFTSTDVAGLRSPGLQGSYSISQALNAILAGSGMTWRFNETNTVVLQKSGIAPGGAITLDPVTVEGRRMSDQGRTEGTQSYAGSQTTVASKLSSTIRETPQSVSVVTRQRIEDRNYTTYDQAMKETTGMVTTPSGHNSSLIKSRGYEVQTQMDGVPTHYSYLHGDGFDLAIYDRLEVLRGPSGLFMGGGGNPGGVVNFVQKRPLRDSFAYGGAASFGSWDFYRGEADVSTPISDKARARFVAVGQDNDTFVDVTHNRRKLGFGSLELDLTERTTLLLGAALQDQNAIHNSGMPAYASGRLLDVNRSTFIGADWHRKATEQYFGVADLEHRFDGGATARLTARWVDRSSGNLATEAAGAVNATTNTVTLNAYRQDDQLEDRSVDTYVSSPFNAFGQEHKLLLGANYRLVDINQQFGSVNSVATGVNVYSPNHSFAPPANIPLSSRTISLTEQYGTYGQARIKALDPLTLIAGARISWWDTKTRNELTNATSNNNSFEKEVSPYYGVVLDITDTLSVYGSYSDIFVPQTQRTSSGEIIKPRVGSQKEAGLKAEFLDKSLIAHFAAFRTDDENRAIQDPNASSFSIPAGKARVEGFETEISGRVTPQWGIFAGYAFTSTRIMQGTGTSTAVTGSVLDGNIPKHLFNLWTKYSFDGGPLDRFSLGGGVKVASRTFGGTTPRFEENGYAIYSSQIAYKLTDDIVASLTVNNIFDEIYYERVNNATFGNYYGEPRSFWFTIRKSF